MIVGFAVVVVLLVGGLILWYLSSCPHTWTHIETYGIYRGEKQVGLKKVYECYTCKKMKSEQIEV